MLKQVQMTPSTGYRLQGMGSREENRQSIQGFNATEEVIQAAIRGSPSLCHPGLVSGSALESVVRGQWSEVGRAKQWSTVEWFSVLRKELLQVPRCKLQQEERRPFSKG